MDQGSVASRLPLFSPRRGCSPPQVTWHQRGFWVVEPAVASLRCAEHWLFVVVILLHGLPHFKITCYTHQVIRLQNVFFIFIIFSVLFYLPNIKF